MVVTFWCPKREHQIDEKICLARQSRKVCICTKGKEVYKNRTINRTRTRKEIFNETNQSSQNLQYQSC